ncbi:MAG: TonB-dependent receptor [Pseudomonadales bacterium]
MAVGALIGTASAQTIEEIVVTATKRDASIQDIPIAVSAFTGEDLAARGVQDLYGLQEIAPSISVYSSNSTSNGGTIRIRGVGTTGNNPGLEAAVGTFIDGVYRSRAGIAFTDLMDIERIEVLRGPQGTLFGKNTSAGALSIITREPQFEQEGTLSASLGNLDAVKVQGSYSNALVDDVLAFRIAGLYHERDGHMKDEVRDERFDSRDRWSVKGQLLWTPADNVESRLIVDYTERDEDCCQARYTFINRELQGQSSTSRGALNNGEPPGAIIDDLLTREGLPLPDPTRNSVIGSNFDPFEDVEDWGVQNELRWDINNNVTLTSITAYREFEVFRGQDIDFSAADIAEPQFTTENFENFSQELQLTFTAGKFDFLVGAYGYTEDIRSASSIRLSSQGPEFLARLQTGLLDQLLGLPPGTFQTEPEFINPFSGLPTGTVRGSALGSFDPVTRTLVRDGTPRGNHEVGDGFAVDFDQDTEGWSIFTDNVWHLTERLDLNFGARYSWEKKKATTLLNGADPVDGTELDLALAMVNGAFDEDHCIGTLTAVGSLCNNASWRRSNTEKEWTGTLKVSYALTDDINVYGGYSRGYKAGGFNLNQQALQVDAFGTFLATGGQAVFLGGRFGLPSDIPQDVLDATGGTGRNGLTQFACGNQTGTVNPLPSDAECLVFVDTASFDPEFVDAFELGLKATFLDGTLTTNLALFYSDFEDFQLNTFTGTGFIISNTRKMVSQGVELETVWMPAVGVQLTFGVTYTDARYDDDLNDPNETESSLFLKQDFIALQDFGELEKVEGKLITHAPLWQGSTSLFVEQPIGRVMGYGNLNVGFRGRHNTGSNLAPEKKVGAETLVNLQLGVRSQDDRWDAQIWARNLFDNHVETLIFDSVFQTGSFSTFFAPPRTYGLTVSTNF